MSTRWFTPIECDNTVAKPLIADSADFKGIRPDQLQSGLRIEAWNPQASFAVTRPDYYGAPDDVLQTHLGSLPVYSDKLKRALVRANITDIQFLPICVRTHSGTPLDGFYIANILTVISPVDWSETVYTTFPEDYFIESRRGKIRDLKSPTLVGELLSEHDIFRLKEFPLYVCVSQKFREAFEDADCTGYSFRELRVKQARNGSIAEATR